MTDLVRWQRIGTAAALFCSGAHAAAATEPEEPLVSGADVERIEVVRGPNVPVFGVNAIPGTVNFDTPVFGRVSLGLP